VSRLIRDSKTLMLPIFDPFTTCRVLPLEKHLRDFLFEILRPTARHGLSSNVLNIILDEIANVNGGARAAVARIRKAWGSSGPFAPD
jgi:hypothetical protein